MNARAEFGLFAGLLGGLLMAMGAVVAFLALMIAYNFY